METRDALAGLFASEGEEVAVGGNNPLLLADPAAVWLVARGQVEVFSVPLREGRLHGSRRHFFSAVEGDLVLGLELDVRGESLGLLAVGLVGTRLSRLPLARLAEAAAEPSLAEGLAGAVERWVAGVSAGAARSVVPRPRAEVQVVPGERTRLGSGQRLRARKGVAWVELRGECTLFIDMEEIPETARDGFLFPLSAEAWMQAATDVEVAAVDTGTALASGRAAGGLQALAASVLRCEFFNSRLEAVDEHNRMREKAARDRTGREQSLAEIAAVLGEFPRPAVAVDPDDSLLAAATLVGRHLGVTVKAPPKPRTDQPDPGRQPLEEIARSSRLRTRPVTLRGEWWTADGGPFLGRREEGGAPVALLPVSPFAYVVQDPVSGVRTPVDREVAASLSAQAHTFYRSLPDRPLVPRDLVDLALEAVKGDFTLPLAVGVGGGLLGMLAPFFMGLLVQEVIPEARRGTLVQLALILLTVTVVTSLFEVVKALSLLRVESRMAAVLQPAMWDRLLTLPARFFRPFTSGDLALRTQGIDQMRRLLSGATVTTLLGSAFSLCSGALLFYYSARLALVAVALVLVALAVTLALGMLKVRLQRQVAEVEGKIAGLVLQLLGGIAKLRVSGAESRAFSRWASRFTQQRRLAFRTGAIGNLMEVFNSVFPVLATMVLFAMVLWLQKGTAETGQPDSLSPGDFVGFSAAFAAVLLQVLATGVTAIQALNVVPLWERARPILEASPEIDPGKADPGELTGRIEVSHVTFRYHADGPAVLIDVSLRIEPGEYVALVGPSGSGKSTLLRMLLGMDVPETGSVYFDGRDLSTLDVQKLRRRIGVVGQGATIRAGSLFTNIVGSLPLTQEDAWTAARLAGLEPDIRQMPMGMNTVLQQGGSTLSGGQRQRLLIARAVVGRPRILLFDEATSALDNRTQALVTKSLTELQATRVAVAHRLSTILGADRIYVLEGGRIVQQGTYRELAEREGLFRELVKRQVT